MKIDKLEYDCSTSELIDKLNEVIDLLNNSFITNDPGEIYGSVVDITCDRLTPLSNEVSHNLQKSMEFEADQFSVYSGIKCPDCNSTHFMVGHSYCTLVNYPPIIKDGININPDRNKSVTTYTCFECGHTWEE